MNYLISEELRDKLLDLADGAYHDEISHALRNLTPAEPVAGVTMEWEDLRARLGTDLSDLLDHLTIVEDRKNPSYRKAIEKDLFDLVNFQLPITPPVPAVWVTRGPTWDDVFEYVRDAECGNRDSSDTTDLIMELLPAPQPVDLSGLQKYDLHESETVSDGVKAHSAWVGPTAIGRFVRLDDVQGSIQGLMAKAPRDAIKAILECHGPGTILPDWAYLKLCEWWFANAKTESPR